MIKKPTPPAMITDLSELPPFEVPLTVHAFGGRALTARLSKLVGKIDNVEYIDSGLDFIMHSKRLTLNMHRVDDIPTIESFECMNMLYYPEIKLAKGDKMTEEFSDIIALNVLRKVQLLYKWIKSN